MPSKLPAEVKQARLEFGALLRSRRENRGWSLEELRTALREHYGHKITRERLRQIEGDGKYDPDNETVKLMSQLLEVEIPDGLKRPAPKKLPGSDGAPPKISLARARKELEEGQNLPDHLKAGMRLRVARIEKGFTQAGLVKAVNAELGGVKPIRVAFVSEAERGIPSLPQRAYEAVLKVTGLGEHDLSPLIQQDTDPLKELEQPLLTLVLASEAWIGGAKAAPNAAALVKASVEQVRAALAGVAA